MQPCAQSGLAVYTGIPTMVEISLNPAFAVGEGLHNDERGQNSRATVRMFSRGSQYELAISLGATGYVLYQ